VSRRMSVSMTLDAVRSRTKTVTRRHVDTWQNLTATDGLTLIEKGMGLPKGAEQVVVAEVEIVSVRVEPLSLVDFAEVQREGLEQRAVDAVLAGEFNSAAEWFVDFWMRGHGYRATDDPWKVPCRRIEWVYLPADVDAATRQAVQ
jgi:hypothetical protein